MTRIVAPEDLAEAVELLRRGELLIYPTETLYALGGVASGDVARRVRAAKGRQEAKALPLVVGDKEQARALCAVWPAFAERLALAFWPGPLTLVLRAGSGVAPEISAGTGCVALRVPGHQVPRGLARQAGPLISTSANLSGQPAAASCRDAVLAVGAHASLALDAGTLGGVASTIVDLTRQPRLRRAGAVSLEALARALREAGGSLQTDSG
jgi:L-threonylcarbamoyladenylate synthase